LANRETKPQGTAEKGLANFEGKGKLERGIGYGWERESDHEGLYAGKGAGNKGCRNTAERVVSISASVRKRHHGPKKRRGKVR